MPLPSRSTARLGSGGVGGTPTWAPPPAEPLAAVRSEIESRLGKFPALFEPAFANPEVLRELWRETRQQWLNTPVPTSFLDGLLAALAERSPWPWQIVSEEAAQMPHAAGTPDPDWPDPDTPDSNEALALTLSMVLDGPDQEVRTRLRSLLGARLYASLIAVLTYLETCLTLAKAHPGLTATATSRYRRAGDPRTVALIEVEADGTIASISPGAEELFGLSAVAAEGIPVGGLFTRSAREPLNRLVDELGRDDPRAPVREHSLEVSGQRSDGGAFDAELRLANRDKEGQPGMLTAIVEPRTLADRLDPTDEPAGEAGRARLAFEGAPVGMALLSLDSGGPEIITQANRAMAVITGYETHDLVGRSLDDFAAPDDKRLDDDLRGQLLAGTIPSYEIVKCLRRADGEFFWGELSVSLIRADDEDRRPLYLVAQLADVSERKRVEDAMYANRDRLASVFDEAPVGMALATLEGRWLQVNAALCETLGYSEEELLGKSLSDLLLPDEVDAIQRYLRQVLSGDVLGYQVETRALRADGDVIWVQLSVSLVHDYDGAPAYVFAEVQDVSERKRVEEELEAGALVDATTGLPSRALLFDRLEQARARLKRHGVPLAVMFASVEGLDAIRERFGSERTDAVLREIAARLLAAVRSGDTVARYRSDEFVVVCENLEHAGEAGAIAARALELGQFEVGDEHASVQLRLALGLTVAAEIGDSAAALVERADAAMQAARADDAGYREYCDSM